MKSSYLQGWCPHSERSHWEPAARAALSLHSLPWSRLHPHTEKQIHHHRVNTRMILFFKQHKPQQTGNLFLVYKNGQFKMVHNRIIIAFQQRHTWYPEKAGSSAVGASSPLPSELKSKLVNCWKTESKLLSVGRTGDGWDKPSTPGQGRESANQSQRSEEEEEQGV